MKNTREEFFPLNCLSETVVKTREIHGNKELPPCNTDTNERKIRGIRDDGRVPLTTTIQTMMMEEEIFFCDEDKDKEEMNHQL